ncbi:AzlC family ABC transporter permease [Methylobrevis pamukkalensis]|uniref:AzlC protein n=1 Tax=Methylobrevis pamukkalensis TaxID=1439726 RepID=A0A1E3H129_9HYPH|nr:AzlC family ABC transporter permease [Methylobrevis pamukkalensis]ODN70002.1 AzlC protein [Methylobrevis pamukkalensis]
MAFAPQSGAGWLLKGCLGVLSVPGFILMASMTGFAGLARESGVTLELATAMTAVIWALPSQVVLVGSIASGASFWATVFAIVLCSVRLMPMVVAILPTIRAAHTPKWQLYVVSTFLAVTSFVVAVAELPKVPRDHRIAWFTGFAGSLVLCNTVVTAVAFAALGSLPPAASACLFFLTPLYFTCSLWAAARLVLERAAFATGFVLLPVCHAIDPTLDLVIAGLAGGTLVYAGDRLWRRRGEG